MERRYDPLPNDITSYDVFFGYYLREHRKPRTRLIHYAGTVIGTSCLFIMIATLNPWFFPLGLALGYGPAWFSHFFVERNKPAAFKYPFWSLISDYRMLWLQVTGKLDNALKNAGVAT